MRMVRIELDPLTTSLILTLQIRHRQATNKALPIGKIIQDILQEKAKELGIKVIEA